MLCDFDQTLIKVIGLDMAGPLPDVLLFDDGTTVDTAQKWRVRRQQIYSSAIELPYGMQPPAPEFLGVELLYRGGKGRSNSYLIRTGTYNAPLTLGMRVFIPKSDGPYPVVIDGDMCFGYAFDKEFVNTFTDNGIALVMFNRTELAHDVADEERQEAGQLYRTYPDLDFGAIAAWAWGFSRCVDALERLDDFDMSCVTFTGHSRGGKAAMLAGALDERAVVVAPNNSGAAGCGCYRINMTAVTEKGEEHRNETLSDIVDRFPYWFGPMLQQYKGREAELPCDSHYLKAMIAPRVLVLSDAADDIWANPVGSWCTTMAAQRVYELLGAEDNLYWYYRRGKHSHMVEDIRRLVSVILHLRNGTPIEDGFFKTPFTPPQL